MHAFVDESVVQYAVVPNIFTILAFVEDRFIMEAVMKLAAKKDALLPDKL